MLGTARYACPEQARGEPADGKGDVYSLGLVLIEAVTGRVPFAADTTIATLMARVDTPVEVSAELGPLRRVLERAGRPDPAERPDAGEFALGLLAASEELSRPEALPLAGATTGAGDITIVDHDPTQLPPVRGAEPAVATASRRRRRRRQPSARRRWPIVVVAIAAVLALIAGAAFAWKNLLIPSHKLPQLVGLTEQQATSAIQAKHWKVRKVDGRKDDSKKGEVIAQDPAEGKSLDENKTVTITVSLGNTLVTVPTDLAGKTLDEATAELTQAGFTLGTQTKQPDETVPAGVDHRARPGHPAAVAEGRSGRRDRLRRPRATKVPALAPTSTFDRRPPRRQGPAIVPAQRRVRRQRARGTDHRHGPARGHRGRATRP